MKFLNQVSPEIDARALACDLRLKDPKRLQELQKTKLMDSPNEAAFDRLAWMAAEILQAPLTLISLVSDKKQFFKAGHGLPAPYSVTREVSIDASICRYTLAGEEIIAADASKNELLMYHPTTEPWGITAFLSIPMKTQGGHVLGSFCAVDTKVREWSARDVRLMRELTNSVMIEIEMRMKIDELAMEKSLREQFVATLTHDLRNPIGVAKMSVELLDDETLAPSERAHLTKMISSNMDRADQMIRDLLNVTNLKVGDPIQLDRKRGSLDSILKSAHESIQALHGEKIKLSINECNLTGDWDDLAIRRILENLVGNAVKYGAQGEIVNVKCVKISNAIEISVQNFGNPIPRSELEHLFVPFQRAQSAIRGSQQGWGIGLALVKGLTEAHGGTISVESSLESGTIFTVSLPTVFTASPTTVFTASPTTTAQIDG